MTDEICTLERFLGDVKGHVFEIKNDDGLYRNITVKKPDSSIYGYKITTWPGYLCISGDMGTYVFSR